VFSGSKKATTILTFIITQKIKHKTIKKINIK